MKNVSPNIRPVEANDYERWKVLWSDYNAFYGRHDATALPEHIVQTTWDRFFDAREPVHCLVAELDGELVGLAHYIFHRNTITVEPTCYLQDLFASENARGIGIGRALFSEFVNQAKIAGVRGVYWHTHSTNGSARRLYDRIAVDTEFTVYRKDV